MRLWNIGADGANVLGAWAATAVAIFSFTENHPAPCDACRNGSCRDFGWNGLWGYSRVLESGGLISMRSLPH